MNLLSLRIFNHSRVLTSDVPIDVSKGDYLIVDKLNVHHEYCLDVHNFNRA